MKHHKIVYCYYYILCIYACTIYWEHNISQSLILQHRYTNKKNNSLNAFVFTLLTILSLSYTLFLRNASPITISKTSTYIWMVNNLRFTYIWKLPKRIFRRKLLWFKLIYSKKILIFKEIVKIKLLDLNKHFYHHHVYKHLI